MSYVYWIVWTCCCLKYTPAELDKHTMYKSLIIFAVYLWIFQNTNSCTSHALYSSWQKLFVNWTLHAICCSSPTQKQFFTLFSPNIFIWRKLTKYSCRQTERVTFLSLCSNYQCASKIPIHWSGKSEKSQLPRPDGGNLTGAPHRSDASSL